MDSIKRGQIERALLEHKGYKRIASEYRVSFRDITRIAREMREPSPFDVFRMVIRGMTPIEIAHETGGGFAEVKRMYGECVDLLGKMNEHSKALKEFEGTELYERLMTVIEGREQIASEGNKADAKEEAEVLTKALVGVKYVCSKCKSPLTDEDVRNLRCPICGHTKYKEV